MTRAQQLLSTGFRTTLLVSGRELVAFLPSANERFTGTVQDAQVLPDPETNAKAQLPVYAEITALSGAISNPRTVTRFMEVSTGRNFTVLRYSENVGNQATWTWFCEAQRA